MKFSIFLPSGFVQDFRGFADPIDAYERVVEIAKTADDAGSAVCLVTVSDPQFGVSRCGPRL